LLISWLPLACPRQGKPARGASLSMLRSGEAAMAVVLLRLTQSRLVPLARQELHLDMHSVTPSSP